MATRSSILAQEISGTEEPGGLQSMELQSVQQDWETEYTTHDAMTVSSREERRLDTGRQREEGPVRTEAETGVMCFHSPGRPRVAGDRQRLGKGQALSQNLRKEPTLTHPEVGLLASRTVGLGYRSPSKPGHLRFASFQFPGRFGHHFKTSVLAPPSAWNTCL